MHINALARLGTIFLAACLSTSSALAAPFSVANEFQLDAAIIAANANNQDDVITLTANIVLTGATLVVGNGPNGVTPIGPDATSGTAHSVTIIGSDFAIDRIPTVAGTLYRLLEVSASGLFGGHLILSDAILRDGNPGAFDGGAILVDPLASIDVSDTTFNNNTAVNGGALSIDGTSLLITRCEFFSNTATDSGGAIEVAGILTSLVDSILYQNNASGSGNGGAIIVQFGGDIDSIINTTFTDNTDLLGNGGAVGVLGRIGLIDQSLFLRNLALNGGAIQASDFSLVANAPGRINLITRTEFRENSASFRGGAISGASVSLLGYPVVVDSITLSQFNSNTAASINGGGAIHLESATLTLIDSSSFTLNDATAGNGGGIFLHGAIINTLENSLFDRDHAALNGGGIFIAPLLTKLSSIIRLTNSTFSGNRAEIDGGAIAFGADVLPNSTVSASQVLFSVITDLDNDTIVENTAGVSGGGVYVDSLGTITNIISTIVALNAVAAITGTGPDVFNAAGTIVNESFNLIGNNSGSTFVAGLPNNNKSFVGTLLNPIDPRVGPLADNGGPTLTRALLTDVPASIAIDHGANPLGLIFDQRGANFARTSGPQTDIGAFEVQQACAHCPDCPKCHKCPCCPKCPKPPEPDEDDDGGNDRGGNGGGGFGGVVPIIPVPAPVVAPAVVPAVVGADVPVVAVNEAPSVTVEAKPVSSGDEGKTTSSSDAESADEAGGCSSFGGVGQSSVNLTMMLLSLLAGLRALRSRKNIVADQGH